MVRDEVIAHEGSTLLETRRFDAKKKRSWNQERLEEWILTDTLASWWMKCPQRTK
jgi:hypothetical protein